MSSPVRDALSPAVLRRVCRRRILHKGSGPPTRTLGDCAGGPVRGRDGCWLRSFEVFKHLRVGKSRKRQARARASCLRAKHRSAAFPPGENDALPSLVRRLQGPFLRRSLPPMQKKTCTAEPGNSAADFAAQSTPCDLCHRQSLRVASATRSANTTSFWEAQQRP
jgi:hypothetical protein